jgi:hypothetical protein
LIPLWQFQVFLDRGSGTLQKLGDGAGVNLMLNPMSWCWLHISVSPNRGEFLEQNGAGSGISCICGCPAGKKYSAAIRYFTSKHIVVSDKKK